MTFRAKEAEKLKDKRKGKAELCTSKILVKPTFFQIYFFKFKNPKIVIYSM